MSMVGGNNDDDDDKWSSVIWTATITSNKKAKNMHILFIYIYIEKERVLFL